jgi:phosphatidylserine/phosphatidylglycerophosphate/cardiolipin synthase-like enzyme
MRHALTALALLILLAGIAACGQPVAAAAPAGPAHAGAGPLTLWQDAAIFTPVRRLLDAAGAGDALSVEMYEFGRADLAAALLRARDRGADVRLIVDRTVPASARTAERLAAAGLPVRAYPVDDHRHQIDHVKLVVTAGAALVGGMNWGANSVRNHDYAFETESPDLLARLRDIFEQDWSLAGGRPAPVTPAAGPVAQTAPGEEVRAALMAALAGARRSVAAEVFVLTDPDVIAGLAGARRRGARVRVLMDPGQDVNRPTLDLLRASGVEVRWYPVAPGAKLHAKAGLFDDREVLLGSANWSRSGLSVNHELDLRSDDPRIAATFGSRFERDWSASA